MKNEDVQSILNEIVNYLEQKEYMRATEYLRSKIREIKEEVNPVSEYMDEMIKDLR